MKIFTKALMLAAVAIMPAAMHAEGVVDFKWNANKVVLPSSQWTPEETYSPLVWIVNTGNRYEGAQGYDNENGFYNHVWDTPSDDRDGNPWYAVNYQPTDKGEIAWQTLSSPFSSDGNYKGKPSTQWVTGDIMGDIYMRRSFTLTSAPTSRLFLAVGHDDAPSEWYINGELVHGVSDGWNNDDRVLLTPEQQALIKTDGSENILAVHVHQNWGGAFADCGLYQSDATYFNYFLPDKGEGPWNCKYKLLDRDVQIPEGNDATWAALDLDEDEWEAGVGPFSNSDDQFKATYWNSNDLHILVRRHFNATQEDIDLLSEGKVIVRCSYDEWPKVYLNGHQICSWERWNDSNYAEYILTAEQKNFFVVGDNVLAVSLQQGGGGGHIDYSLTFEMPYIEGNDLTEQKNDLEAIIDKCEAKFPATKALTAALNEAKNILANSNKASELVDATEKLTNLFNEIKSADIPMYNYSITIPLMGSTDYSKAAEIYDNATTKGAFEDALRELRYARRRAAADKHADVFEGAAPAAGDYYIYNLGQKQFLCGGSDWGAHAALGFPGIKVTLEAEEGFEGSYRINTYLNNGGESQYVNYWGYCDCAPGRGFRFLPVDGKENVFNIVQDDWKDAYWIWNPYANTDQHNNDETTVCTEQRGVDPNDPNAQWKLVTREERVALLDKAAIDNPADATFFIQSPNFSQREHAEDVWNHTNASVWEYGRNHYDFIMESWDSTDCDINQVVEGLPAGTYRLSVQGYYRNGHHADQPNLDLSQNAFLYAFLDDEIAKPLPNITAESYHAPGEGDNARTSDQSIEYQIPNSGVQATNYFKSGLYKTYLVFDLAEGETPMIGVYKDVKGADGDWVVVDNFRLTYYGAETSKEAVEEMLSGVEAPVVEAPEFKGDNRIFNLQGIQVKDATRPGIYIRNGKKFIVK